MIENPEILQKISPLFTEEVLKNIVAKDKNVPPSSVEIVSCNFSERRNKGDSYLSIISRLLLVSKVKGGLADTKIIVKSFPESIGARKTLRCSDFFRNEIAFYDEVAGNLKDFLKQRNLSHLWYAPECLASKTDGENDYIVLQDVCQFGFHSIPRHEIMSYENSKTIVEAMARFHSVSLAIKNENKQKFDEMASKLTESYFTSHFYETWYKQFHLNVIQISKDALTQEYPGSKAEKVFNSYQAEKLFEKCVEHCSRPFHPSSVFCQGDPWMPNFMIRETDAEKPDVLMLDFQVARCCSPALDLSVFIYVSTDKNFRDKYYDNLLKDYYQELDKSCRLFGLNIDDIYSWNSFRAEIKDQSVFGLVFAMEAVPVIVLPEEEAFDLDHITESVNIAEVWKLSNIKDKKNRLRLADIIVHAVENDFI